MAHEIDPVLAAVICNRLAAITREIGETMLRTSRSPIFSEARDFVTAIFDHKLRWVANKGYIPVIAGTAPHAQRAIAEAFDGDIHEGDVFILNDPYRGNNHPPDITVTKPVFYQGQLRFWAMAKGHNADVGGGGVVGYNPAARDCWEDALRIPPMKLYERGRYRKDVWDMILLNLRIPFLVEGDLHCQVGAATLGERALVGLVEKYGPDTVEAAIDYLIVASERQMRAEIQKIPNGRYTAERLIDNDGVGRDRPIAIRLAVLVEDEEIIFDFTGTDPQARGYVNSSYSNTVSSCKLALFSCIDPDVPMNEGSTRVVKVIAPEGSVVNPREPAPTTLCTVSTCEAITECGWLALAQAIPERSNAVWARWFGPASMGLNPRTGRPFAEIHFMTKGGGGATQGFDGWDHLGTPVCLGGIRAPDPELHELVSPYTILRYEYLTDTAGPGQWRGGAGVACSWRVEADGIPMAFFGSGTLPETAPTGILGGAGSQPNRAVLRRAGNSEEPLDANTMLMVNAGDVIESYSSGGGGCGHPFDRPVEKVWADVRDGLVSVEAARDLYGVALDPITQEVDREATERLRATRK